MYLKIVTFPSSLRDLLIGAVLVVDSLGLDYVNVEL